AATSQAGLLGIVSPKVAALTDGILKSMLVAKLKVGLSLLAALFCVGVSLVIGLGTGTAEPVAPTFVRIPDDPGTRALFSDELYPGGDPVGRVRRATAGVDPPEGPAEPAAKTELEGVWERVVAVKHGEKLEVLKGTEVTIERDRFELKVGNKRITVGTF